MRDEALLSLEEAIRKMTSAPRPPGSGCATGAAPRRAAYADIVVFDPATVRSNATYDEPRQFPDGIEHVIVNGTMVVGRRRAHGRDARAAGSASAATDGSPLGTEGRKLGDRGPPVFGRRRGRMAAAGRPPPAWRSASRGADLSTGGASAKRPDAADFRRQGGRSGHPEVHRTADYAITDLGGR